MLLRAPNLILRAAPPPVPSLIPIYKTTLTTTANEDTTVWTGVDIGLPHPKRLIVLAGYRGVSVSFNPTQVSVNGIQACETERAREWLLAAVPEPTGMKLAEISVTGTGSVRKAVSVWVYYPERLPTQDDFFGVGNVAGTTDANVANVTARAKGCLLYAGGQTATLGTFTTTWGGADAVVKDVEAQLESATSYTAGHINFTVSSNTNAINMAESNSGTKNLVAMSLPPPYRGR